MIAHGDMKKKNPTGSFQPERKTKPLAPSYIVRKNSQLNE